MRAKQKCMECESSDKTNVHIHVKMHEHARNANQNDNSNVQLWNWMHEHARNANQDDNSNVQLCGDESYLWHFKVSFQRILVMYWHKHLERTCNKFMHNALNA